LKGKKKPIAGGRSLQTPRKEGGRKRERALGPTVFSCDILEKGGKKKGELVMREDFKLFSKKGRGGKKETG